MVGLEAIAGKMQLLKNELGFVIDKKTLAIQLHGTLLTRMGKKKLKKKKEKKKKPK